MGALPILKQMVLFRDRYAEDVCILYNYLFETMSLVFRTEQHICGAGKEMTATLGFALDVCSIDQKLCQQATL